MTFKAFVILLFAAVVVLLPFGANAQSNKQYWMVGGDTLHVWSLSDNQFVDVSNTGYVAWLTLPGSNTSKIPDTSSLYNVIASTYPDHLPVSAPILEANGGLSPQQSYDWRKAAGLNIAYTGQPTLSGRYPIDDIWLDRLMKGALLRCGTTALSLCSTPFPFNAATYTYFDLGGAPRNMSIVQMQVITLAIQDYSAELYAQLWIGLGGSAPTWPSSTVTVP
jgi:hypothetical protein